MREIARKGEKLNKLLFNDSRQIEVQSVKESAGVLHARMILTTAEELKSLFGDTFATRKMTYFENQIEKAVYENYTIFEYVKEETGGIFEVEMKQKEKDTNTRIAELEKKDIEREAAIQKMKEEGVGEDYSSVLYVAKLQAQTLDDSDAINVKKLYPKWEDVVGEIVNAGYKFLYGDVLYKVRQDDTEIQEYYIPGQGTESLYEVIDETHAGTIEDPIPYNNNMELIEGKYYIQNEVIYCCTRSTGQAVYNNLTDLVGLYVQIAEAE